MSSLPGDLDPAALGPDAVRAVRDLLRTLGCTDEELDRAQREGTLPLLAVERLIVPEAPAYTLDDVTARTGISAEQVAQLWRTLGYPEPRPGELAFTGTDLDILTEIGQLMAQDVTSHDLVLQLSRRDRVVDGPGGLGPGRRDQRPGQRLAPPRCGRRAAGHR